MFSSGFILASTLAEETGANEPTASPSKSDAELVAKTVELSTANKNRKLLAQLAGTWSYIAKAWPTADASPIRAKGTAIRKPIMDGRYFVANFTSKTHMPGENGKLKTFEYKAMSIEGYDNVQKKFTATWCDTVSPGIMLLTGSYDPTTKTFTYNSESELMPGVKTKVREVLRIVDDDHLNFEWYEYRDGQEVKTMEINYTRQE